MSTKTLAASLAGSHVSHGRGYTIKHTPGQHLDFWMREILARDWNRRIEANDAKLSIRSFAKEHGPSESTWHREFARGAEGKAVKDIKHPGRFRYARYNPFIAQEEVDADKRNKGAPMRLTNRVAARFPELVLDENRSPFDARCILAGEMPDAVLPCVRTFYNHIEAGDIGVKYGQTPYHPDRRRKKPKAHRARHVPWRNSIDERPAAANERSETGHLEMDTIVSCVGISPERSEHCEAMSLEGCKGGLLVLIDRKSRFYTIGKIAHVNQACVIAALRRMKKRGVLDGVKSVTTDNGCEFLDQTLLEKTLGCKVYYTRDYASCEKGSVENANRIVRRWYPKGTDFSCLARGDVVELERLVNSIHRLSLGGMSAAAFRSLQQPAA